MHFPKIHAAFMTEISCFEVTVRLFERCPLLSKDISKGIVFVLQRILCFKAAIQIYGNIYIYICINICVYIYMYIHECILRSNRGSIHEAWTTGVSISSSGSLPALGFP